MGSLSAKNDKVYPYDTEFQLDENKMTSSRGPARMNGLHARNRKPTDVCFFTMFVMFLTVLCGFIGYCVYYGDIGRVIHGYDNCGTVCGDRRRDNKLQACYKTTDESNFGSYHLVFYKPGQSKIYDRICTNSCKHYTGYKEFLNRCLPSDKKVAIDKFFTKTGLKDFFVEVSEDFQVYWKVFVYVCFLSLGAILIIHAAIFLTAISLGFLVLFPFLAGLMVWIILVGVVCACVGVSTYLWLSWKDIHDQQNMDSEIKSKEVWTYLALAIASSCLTMILVLVILIMLKRIKLVIQLFEEAGTAISGMPGLLFEPILTFLSLIATISLWIYFCLWISSAGHLEEKRQNIYYYKKDGFMEAAKVLNFFGMLWMVQFMIGCQHMIIAGAVSKWYFTRGVLKYRKGPLLCRKIWDKPKLSSPITESFYNLTRYHLGTVAMGSFLLAVVQLLRLFVASLQKLVKNEKSSVAIWLTKMCFCVCNCCLWVLEHILNILSRNAYIITAMHGHSFYKAGKQAFSHLVSNPLRVAAINSLGDFVLFLSKVLVVACSVGIGAYFLKEKEGVQHVWVPLVLVGLFSYFFSHCFMTVYEMTIDTIFICFCEDCEVNDGISKPYYMSRGLMEFVENSKKAMDVNDSEKGEAQDTISDLPTVSGSVKPPK